MTELEYIQKLKQHWPATHSGNIPRSLMEVEEIQPKVEEALELVGLALTQYPQSASLLCAKGDLILLSEAHSVEDARKYYEMALKSEPANPEPYIGLGDYFDCTLDDPHGAIPSYSKSIELAGDERAYMGLARSLAELGNKTEALRALSPSQCPFAHTTEVRILKKEIENDHWVRSGNDEV